MSQQNLPNLTNGGGSSQQQRGVPVEKPRSDIYTVMLLIALIAVGAAIGCLCAEMSEYNWDYKAPKINTAPPAPTSMLETASPRVAWHAIEQRIV